MSVLTQEKPATENPTPDESEAIELPKTYQDILEADNPSSLIEQLDANPEHLSSLLSMAEQEVGIAGAELSLGRQTDDEVTTFNEKQSDYQSFVELIVAHKVDKMIADGSTEEEIDQTVVDMLVDSRKSVISADLSHRLDSSFIESVEEKIAKTKFRRITGAIALAAAGVVSIYGTQKGITIAGDTIGRGDGLSLGLSFMGLAGIEAEKFGFSKASSKLTAGINKYRSPKRGELNDESSEVTKDNERQFIEEQATDLKKELLLITATHHDSKGMSKDTLGLVIDKFGSTMKEMYGIVERHNKAKGALEIGSVVLASALVDQYAQSDTIANLEGAIGNN